jgi:hypothetical protein
MYIPCLAFRWCSANNFFFRNFFSSAHGIGHVAIMMFFLTLCASLKYFFCFMPKTRGSIYSKSHLLQLHICSFFSLENIYVHYVAYRTLKDKLPVSLKVPFLIYQILHFIICGMTPICMNLRPFYLKMQLCVWVFSL